MAASRKKSTDTPLSFEHGLARLESLVDQLEAGELSLEQGVDHYREGVELLEILQTQLAGAEGKVEQLTEQLRRTVTALEQDEPNSNDA
jgi:exodeoxyribonuclease VII small subunit